MIRALYTAASGMNAQQANIDNVAHNLANVNTTGFKKSRMRVRGSRLPADQGARGADVGGKARRRSASTRGSARAPWQRRATSAPATCAQTELAARLRDRGRRVLPDLAAGWRDGLHARRHAAPERRGPGRDERGLPARAGDHDSRERTSASRSRRTASCRPRRRGSAPQQIGTIELATFQNPAGLEPRGGNIFVVSDASGDPHHRRAWHATASAPSRRASSKTRT